MHMLINPFFRLAPHLVYQEGQAYHFHDHELSDLIERSGLPDLSTLNGQTVYDKLTDLLRASNDAQFGITSYLNKQGEWVRDATDAIDLKQRMPHDSPVIEANNALLRCLSRLKAIDFAIGQKMSENGEGPRLELKEAFAKIAGKVMMFVNDPNMAKDRQRQEIKALEEKFNGILIHHLHQANLTKGCNSAEDAEKLLFHYRNLSSLMQPARPLVTLSYDDKARVFQRETQYPVTKKTEAQHEALKTLKKLTPCPFKDEKNSHTVRNLAAQEADSLFFELMDDDTRCLSAQARKTHLVGVKNAFVVKNELIPLKEGEALEQVKLREAAVDDTLWFARTAVPVFVGSGENNPRIQQHTQENLEQIRARASELMGKKDPLHLHVSCLNTYSPQENQASMVNHLFEATRYQKKGDDISYMPTNLDGTFRQLDISPTLFDSHENAPSGIAPLQKSTRLHSVCKVILRAFKKENTLSIIQCASGQDRTGTAAELTTQEWMRERYTAYKLPTDNIETMRAKSGNAADITSHLLPGSSGIKEESMANNTFGSARTFSKEASEQFYLHSAHTNKKNKVNKDDVLFLKKPSNALLKEFNQELAAFKESLSTFNKTVDSKEKQAFYDMALSVLKNIHALTNESPEGMDAQGLMQLTTMLPHCTTLLKDQNVSHSGPKESMRRLASLSQEVSGKRSPVWKALGAGLITFACLALVVGGVLAAIPTGGTSLLVAAIGATGLSMGAALGIGATAVSVTAATGIGLYAVGREKGLAKSLTDFKSSYLELNDEGEDTLDTPSLH